MNRANLFGMIGLVAGTALGLVASGSLGGFGSGSTGAAPPGGTDHSGHQMESHDHSKMIEIGPEEEISLRVALIPEGGCSYGMQLFVPGFTFAPERANGPHVPGEGHAHLYIDGVKHARIYGHWFHFTAPKGAKTIEVTLTANDHAALARGGTPITASAVLDDCKEG